MLSQSAPEAIVDMTSHVAKKLKTTTKVDDKDAFLAIFPTLIDDVFATLPKNMPEDGKEWLRKNFEYNTPGGKLNRGLMVPTTLALLKAANDSTDESPSLSADDLFKSQILGWCIELLQAFFLVADDVMDGSHTRRGQPCWFRLPEIGLVAINDGMLLESAIFTLLKKYFRQDSCYLDLIELFHETIFQTELGQLMDLITAPEDIVNLDKFSLDKYNWIVEYKTAYYSFYLPVAVGMHMAGISDPALFQTAKDILIPLGRYFQIQDDYLDCYGDPKHIGKIGTDIQDNKCSWLVNRALQLVTPAQRLVLEINYGKKNLVCEAKVKALYREMDMQKEYTLLEEKSYTAMTDAIAHVKDQRLVRVFESFVKRIYKRDK